MKKKSIKYILQHGLKSITRDQQEFNPGLRIQLLYGSPTTIKGRLHTGIFAVEVQKISFYPEDLRPLPNLQECKTNIEIDQMFVRFFAYSL